MGYKLWIGTNEGKDCPYKEPKEKKKFLYDSSSGNYHLMPKKLWIAKQISSEISGKLNGLKDELQKQLEEKKIEYVKGRGIRLRHDPRITVFQEDGFEEARYIYSNLSVALSSNPNRTYSLMCFSFCKHENIVECILKSIQYETEIDILSSDIYPESLQDNDKSKIKAEDKFQYYYNPKVDFGDDNKKIIEDFIKFIERNENNICKDIEQ